jgi:hypothetical protein
MRQWCSRWTLEMCLEVLAHYALPTGESIQGPGPWNRPPKHPEWCNVEEFPLPWIWQGVSVENQEAADERIPELLATKAAVRLLSCEPLLGPVDLTRIGEWRGEPLSALDEIVGHVNRPRIDWVIAGCESGPDARPCKVAWLRSLRDQCAAASVPYFLKQAWGEYWPEGMAPASVATTSGTGSKRKAGGIITLPYLDGQQHKAFPVDQ